MPKSIPSEVGGILLRTATTDVRDWDGGAWRTSMDCHRRSRLFIIRQQRTFISVSLPLFLLVASGCWAPLASPGIPASSLPDEFRTPYKTLAPQLNLASLTRPPVPDYILGPNDVLEVLVYGLYEGVNPVPVRAQIMASGHVQLPLVGPVRVAGLNILQAHQAISEAYADGFINEPRINVYLAERSVVSVLVLGEVARPGVYPLPKYENDVAHALASAGGLGIDAEAEIEIHRRLSPEEVAAHRVERLPDVHREQPLTPAQLEEVVPFACAPFTEQEPMRIVRIPLRGFPNQPVLAQDVILQTGDVVLVPSRKNEVFFVVGRLSPTNFVRFNIGARERDLGAGFVLPRDRDIDVVTAVAMAGYIDPIESPTTVTVHRTTPMGQPMLIRVDLIAARYDARENVMVQPGDIIYLNPDLAWWSRMTIDRLIEPLFSLSYRRVLGLGSD